MKRSWQVWLLYAACLAVALPALGWLTWAALGLERAERTARQQAQRDEQIRLASWRIDTMLMGVVAPAAARSYDEMAPYLSSVPPTKAVPPPPASKCVLAYFELGPSGWTFSRFFHGGKSADREAQQLRAAGGYDDVLARLPSEWLPADANSQPENLAYLDRAAKASQPNQAAEIAAPQVDDEFLRRQQFNLKNTAREIVQQRVSNGLVRSPNVREGVSRPLWVGGQLLVARRVELDGRQIVQGSWLDWNQLRSDMRAEVSDLLPAVRLVPLANETDVNYAHTLAALPVQLVVPAAAATDARWTPLRLALAMAWVGLLAVAAAAAALLAGMISLGHRREAFVSAVTHELRTPLTTFRMYAEMLGSGMVADEATRKDYVRTLKVEADRLWHLVENVLAYARLERGRPAHQCERLTLTELWQRVEPRLSDRARQADMKLALDYTAGSRNGDLVTDPAAVEQILFNLVDNACKYAARATSRTIAVQLAADNGHVEIRVRDSGAGIALADARRLFRPFSKSAERAAASAPGVGLGLALCRKLARQMRGDLRYEPGSSGATFVLTLPRA